MPLLPTPGSGPDFLAVLQVFCAHDYFQVVQHAFCAHDQESLAAFTIFTLTIGTS